MSSVAVAAATSYAFTLGLVAAVNPCGFPLLPAYLALFTGGSVASDYDGGAHRTGPASQAPANQAPTNQAPANQTSRTGQTARGLIAGAGVTVGFVAVFGTLGLLLASGAALISTTTLTSGWLSWFMMGVGILMAALGISTLFGHPLYLRLPTPWRALGGRTFTATFIFGVAYAIGSLSCALPLFLAAVSGASTRLGFAAGLACYLSYALGMGLFVTAAAVVTATTGGGFLRHFRRAGRVLPGVSGAVLTLSGLYLLYFWTAEAFQFSAGTSLLTTLSTVQGSVTSFLAGHLVVSAVALLAAVLTGIAAVVRKSWTGQTNSPEQKIHQGSPHD